MVIGYTFRIGYTPRRLFSKYSKVNQCKLEKGSLPKLSSEVQVE
jgi:hypothetical protein